MNMPRIGSYGNYSSSNYGAHCLCVDLECGVTVWFSYQTAVAFRTAEGRVVHANHWSRTTGKHLNWIDGGTKEAVAARVQSDEFQRLWAERVASQLEADHPVGRVY